MTSSSSSSSSSSSASSSSSCASESEEKSSDDGATKQAVIASVNKGQLGAFFRFLQCQLRMEARQCLGEEVVLKDKYAETMWAKYEPFVRPSLGGKEKWMPYHTVLGVHELFIVREIHQAKVECWDDRRRFLAMFIYRTHCRGELFKQVQLPFLSSDSFWENPVKSFDMNGEVAQAMLEYRRNGKAAMQTQAFRCIPTRILDDDDENLVLNIVQRTQTLLEVGDAVWPIVNNKKMSAKKKFEEISNAIKQGDRLGETWSKMIMVSIDIWRPDIGLLANQCDVGIGAIVPLRSILPGKPEDNQEALEALTKIANHAKSSSVRKFRKLLPKVEARARKKFGDLPQVLLQMEKTSPPISAVTLQVQLCEWRQYKEFVQKFKRKHGTKWRLLRKAPSPRKERRQTAPEAKKPDVNTLQQAPCENGSADLPQGQKRKADDAVYRIGCIGDSCTMGTRIKEDEKYPAQLKRILEERCPSLQFEVGNFGVCGKTAGETPRKSYADTKHWGRALAMEANAYPIMLGTNDAWHGEPKKYESGLRKLVVKLRQSVPGTLVVLVLPPGTKMGRLTAYMNSDIVPALRRVAADLQCPVVEPALEPAGYQADKVHLSPEGAQTIAEAVATVLLREKDRQRVKIVAESEVPQQEKKNVWCCSAEPQMSIGQLISKWQEEHPNIPMGAVGLDTDTLLDVDKSLTIAEVRQKQAPGLLVFKAFPIDSRLVAAEKECMDDVEDVDFVSDESTDEANNRLTEMDVAGSDSGTLPVESDEAPPSAEVSPPAQVQSAQEPKVPSIPSKKPSVPCKETKAAVSAEPAAAKNNAVDGKEYPQGDAPVEFMQENPKRPYTEAWARYDKYKLAKTVNEAMSLGAAKGDIINDCKKGLCWRVVL